MTPKSKSNGVSWTMAFWLKRQRRGCFTGKGLGFYRKPGQQVGYCVLQIRPTSGRAGIAQKPPPAAAADKRLSLLTASWSSERNHLPRRKGIL
ncbi:hypothetical protein RHMOL_Rhmol04G0168300 [Rhododendron molle]|uniref:Uncharacterized protein n=1 Tax=Rhododendron molle TaxID=49168 RepID=A0ACC0P168_RHOML|nr:hypothetical protein RHMOL_Rhmol04G0168300 [Rhododendron molle]